MYDVGLFDLFCEMCIDLLCVVFCDVLNGNYFVWIVVIDVNGFEGLLCIYVFECCVMGFDVSVL